MNIWKILGIEPTRDDSAIRRAYAKQLKIHRPDSDPAAYQKLREAFDAAKAYASWEFDEEDEYEDGNDSDIDEDWSDEVEPENHESDVFYINPSDIITTEWDHSANEISVDGFDQQSKDAQDAQNFTLEDLAEPENLYTEQEIRGLVHRFVYTGNTRELKQFWLKVSAEGSLRQQQLFHQHVAAAISDESGLEEYHVERVSRLLDWGLDEYGANHTIPISIQHAIEQQLTQTKVSYALRQLDKKAKHGSFLDAAWIRLLKSKQYHIPFWMYLIPDMLPKLLRRANEFITLYPELESYLNPSVLKDLQQSCIEITRKGIFLFVFWVCTFFIAEHSSESSTGVKMTAFAIVIFYLYLPNLIENSLKGYPKLLTYFLGIECIFSLGVLLLSAGGLLFCIVNAMNDSRGLLGLLFGILSIMILCFLLWKAWSKDAPLIRRPSKALYWIFSRPWMLLNNKVGFAKKIYSSVCLVVYYVIAFVAMDNLLILFS